MGFLDQLKDAGADAASDMKKILTKDDFQRALIRFTNGTVEHPAYALQLLKTDIDDETLSDLRANIAGLTGSIEISNFPFCTKDGFIVQDATLVQDYLTIDIGINPKEAKTLPIYMRDAKIAGRHVSVADEAISAVMPADKLAQLKLTVNEEAFKHITGTAAKYVPELEQRDWAIISDSNALCYGLRVIRVKGQDGDDTSRGTPIGVERARRAAFRLRKRAIWSDSIPSSSIEGVKMDLRIPDYIIDDKSYVSIYETETEMQVSMAASSFSETDVSAAGSASFGMFSGSASMSFAAESSKATSSSSGSKSKKVTIAYNFPRVTLFLDSRSLELAPDFEQALRDAQTKQDLYKVQDMYGEFFSSRVQLGGRLFATEDAESSESSSSASQIKAMKVAAAASLGGWGVSVGVSGGHAESEAGQGAQAEGSASKSLTWQANGGDTLLANRPAEWSPTVAYHWNWRVTKQDHIANILDVASQINGMGWLPEHAKKWGVEVDPDALDSNRFISRPASDRPASFQLHVKTTFGDKRYLQAWPASSRTLVPAAEYWNKNAGEGDPKVPYGGELRDRGLMRLSSKHEPGSLTQRVFEAEDMDGAVVSDVMYNTKYRLVTHARDSKLYLDTYSDSGLRYVHAYPTRSETVFVSLVDPNDDSDTVKEVPHGSQVVLRTWSAEDLVTTLGDVTAMGVSNDSPTAQTGFIFTTKSKLMKQFKPLALVLSYGE